MSIFKDKAIVIKIDKLKDKELLYTLFTYEYWKIKAVKKISKREKSLDLWYIINFEIVTKENSSIHKIKNIKIMSQFNIEKNMNFNELNLYLEILTKVYKEIPDWLENKEVFSIIDAINNKKIINEEKLILSKLKIKSLLWDLIIDNKDKTIEKILKYINNSKIDDILKLKINDEKITTILREI